MSSLIQRTYRLCTYLRMRNLRVQDIRFPWNLRRRNSSSSIWSSTALFRRNEKHNFNTEINFSQAKDKLLSITTVVEYENISEETLQSIFDHFEEILQTSHLHTYDVSYSNDVLTVTLDPHGVYVINKQSPNRQIWLSSPFSGPKRYDFIDGIWIYKRDGVSLHQLLNKEMIELIERADFESCAYGGSSQKGD